MTETKWTPGPWAMPDVGIGIISKFISPGRWDGMIATADCGNYARSRSEGLANANLISAAPDLYTSVERLLLEFDVMIERGVIPDVRDDIIFDNARAAMRKARGE